MKIVQKQKERIPPPKLNLRLNKEGVEMVRAIKRRKETQNQYDILANRIKHLKEQ